MNLSKVFIFALILIFSACVQPSDTQNSGEENIQGTTDPLPSWNDENTKEAIISFVKSVTDKGSDAYLPESERIATFDNDGTLWSEKPIYFQLFFTLDRVRAMASEHPEWTDKEPFASVLKGDMKGVMDSGLKGIMELAMATHSGMTADEFESIAQNWLDTAKHQQTSMRYKDMIYQPMLEVMDYLRENDFQVYIVSGGGINFIRAYSPETYGVAKANVVGTYLASEFEEVNGEYHLVAKPEMDFIDDGADKPVAIGRFIGQRPIAAFGNSDGDLQMLQYTTSGDRPSLALFVHHTDAEREYAYDRDSHVGKLDKGLDEARKKGWAIADMKNDWKVIYPEN